MNQQIKPIPMKPIPMKTPVFTINRRAFAGRLASALAASVFPSLWLPRAASAADRKKPRSDGAFNAKPAKGEWQRDTLKVGDAAPDFTLPDAAGRTQFTLSSSWGRKPVVLIFGSCTCPPFRRQVGEMEQIYQTYKDKAGFALVYIREAHPGSRIPGINAGETINQTETLAGRMKLAAEFARELKLTLPVLVDKEDNKVNAAYAGWPNRLVVVGVDGKLAYVEKQGASFMPSATAEWLKQNTATTAPAAR